MGKRALILGIGGMDGSHLCETLLENDYIIGGTSRRCSVDNLKRIRHINDKIAKMYKVEVTDPLSIRHAVVDFCPHEIYHMADQDNVGWSYDTAKTSCDVTAGGVSNLLEVVKKHIVPTKVFIPISATVYGDHPSFQDETTPHNPLSPYACAKSHAYHLARYYRQCYGMHVSTGIMYNHDSPRRSGGYLLHTIYDGAKKCTFDKNHKIKIGSLEMKVDIGYAREYMQGVYDLMQLDTPIDLILSTNKGYKIQDIIAYYLSKFNLSTTNRIEHNPEFSYLGPQVELLGNSNKARELIGWNPKIDAMGMLNVLDKGE